MNKPAVKTIIETLTPGAICAALDVTPHAVRYAKMKGVFPAAWYGYLREASAAAGIDCPMEAFTWKGSSPPANGLPEPGEAA